MEPQAEVVGTVAVRRASQRTDEKELIRAAQRGDPDAFEQLVRSYDQNVLRMAFNLLHSEEDARDIYQEAFLKAYRHIGNFRFECSFYTWIYRIVTNLCLDLKDVGHGRKNLPEMGNGKQRHTPACTKAESGL